VADPERVCDLGVRAWVNDKAPEELIDGVEYAFALSRIKLDDGRVELVVVRCRCRYQSWLDLRSEACDGFLEVELAIFDYLGSMNACAASAGPVSVVGIASLLSQALQRLGWWRGPGANRPRGLIG
jgi:hypothetical protein